MANAFNLTAQLNLRGPANIKTVVADIRRQIGTVDAELRFRIDPNTTRNVTQLNSALRAFNTTLNTTQATATNAARAISSLGRAVSSVNVRNLPQQVNSSAASINKLASSSAATAKSLQSASTEMQEFGKQAYLAARRNAAFTIVAGTIFGVTNAIRKGVDAFIEYDKQFVKLQQITGESAEGLQNLSRSITSLATGLGVASSDITEVASTLAQAGLSARDTERALKALALSSLAPSFDSMNETVEGSIALMRQFGISAGQLEGALGSINSVAAKFAVEASDIITAIQRTGGVFAAASNGVSEGTDALNEFISVFTSVRATTRESAETIATGLRTIFTRIQRGSTIEALKDYGVNLTDVEGKFVGAFKAVQLLSQGLSSLDPRDLRFSQIVEELGGFRQIGKVIPLIQQFSVAQEALKVAQKGQGSLAADAAKAQDSLANKIVKVKEEFFALFKEIGRSDGFQTLVRGALDLSSALIKIADSIKGVLPAIGIFAAFKGVSALTQFSTGFFGGARSRSKADGGRIYKFQSGGVVPGYGKGDKVQALLEPGEVVINNNAANKYGRDNLLKMNRYATGSKVQKFEKGKYVKATISNLKTISPSITTNKVMQPTDLVGSRINYKEIPLDRKDFPKIYANAIGVREDTAKLLDQYKDDPRALRDIQKARGATFFSKIKKTNLYRADNAVKGLAFEKYIEQRFPQLKAASSGTDSLGDILWSPLDFATGDAKFINDQNIDNYRTSQGQMVILSKRLRDQNKGNNLKWTVKTPESRILKPTTVYISPRGMKQAFDNYYANKTNKILRQESPSRKALGGFIQKFVGGGKGRFLGARSKFKELSEQEISQLSTPDLISYGKSLMRDIFTTGGAGMAIGNEFIEVPKERIVPELDQYLTSYLGKRGFWREKVAPFAKAIENKTRDGVARRMDSRTLRKMVATAGGVDSSALKDVNIETLLKYAEQAPRAPKAVLEATIARYQKDPGIKGGFLKRFEQAAKNKEFISGKPLLDKIPDIPERLIAFRKSLEKELSEVQDEEFKKGIVDKIVKTSNAIQEAKDYQRGVLPTVTGRASHFAWAMRQAIPESKNFANGGLVQKFANGSVSGVEAPARPASPDILDKLKKLGGNTGIVSYYPSTRDEGEVKSAGESLRSAVAEALTGSGLTAKQLFDARVLGARPDGSRFEPALKKVLEAAEAAKKAKQKNKANQIARNMQAASGGAYQFGLASIYGPNGELGFDKLSDAREIEGKDGQKYLTQIVQKSLPTRYAKAIEETRMDLADAPARGAARMQYADIFGTQGPLAFDFDDTLVKNADIFTKDGKIDILGYNDPQKVKAALKNAKLTLLGKELAKRLIDHPQLMEHIRVLTARPQSNAPLLAATLSRLSLPIPESKITGVSGGLKKVNNMSDFETLIDDNIDNIQSVLSGGKRAIPYSEPLKLDPSQPSSKRNLDMMESYAFEEMLRSLGVRVTPDEDAKPLRPIDYPSGLGKNSYIWGFKPNMPVDTKRTNSSDAVGRLFQEAKTYYRQNFAKGGKVDYYSLEKNSGFSAREFNMLVDFAKTNDFTLNEFRDYLTQQLQQKKAKADLRVNPYDVLRAVTPAAPTSTAKQLSLAESLKGPVDAKYNPKYDNAIQNRASGGSIGNTVPAMVSNGEAFVPPETARRVGYAKLNRLNRADTNGLKGFSSGGISVFRGPGTGTSDSIGPIGLPEGSFILREKATKALGLASGGKIKSFASGGSPGSGSTNNAGPNVNLFASKLIRDADISNIRLFTSSIENLASKLNPTSNMVRLASSSLGAMSQETQKIYNASRTGKVSLSQLITAIEKDLRSATSSGKYSIDQLADAAKVLANTRDIQTAASSALSDRKYSRLNAATSFVSGAFGNTLGKIPGVSKIKAIGSGLAGQPGFMMSMALGTLAGQGENIFGKETGRRNNGGMLGASGANAFTAAGLEAGTTTLSAGLATASSLAMIPGVGPFAAALTLGVTAVSAWTNAVEAGKKAAEDFATAQRQKSIDDANDKLVKSLERLSKDPTKAANQSSVIKNAAAVSSQISEKTAADIQIAERRKGETRTWTQWAMGMDRPTLGANEISEIAQNNAKAAEPAADAARRAIEARISSGTKVSELSSMPDFKNLLLAVAGADKEFATIAAMSDESVAAMGTTKERMIAEKLNIVGMKLMNDEYFKNIESTTAAAKAMEEANKAGRKLAMSFDRMSNSFNQALGRVNYELENAANSFSGTIAAFEGKARLIEVSSGDANILKNPKAYSAVEVQRAQNRASSFFGDDKEAVKQMLGVSSTDFALDLTRTIQDSLDSNKGLELDAAAQKARKQLESKVAGAPENVRSEILGRFDAILKQITNSEGTNEDKVNKFVDRLEQELGTAASDAAKKVQEMAVAVLEFRNNALNKFISATNLAAEAQSRAQASSFEAQDIMLSGRDRIREAIGRQGASPMELRNRMNNRISQLTGGVTDPRAIGQNIKRDIAARETLEQKQKELKDDPTKTKEFEKVTNDLAILNQRINNGSQALSEFSKNADVASAALNEIKRIQEAMSGQGEFLDKLATSTPEEAEKLGRSFQRLMNNLNGMTNNPANSYEAQEAFIKTLQETGNPYAAQNAGMAVMAQQRGETLSLFKELLPVIQAQMLNSGLSPDVVMQRINEMNARVREGTYREAGIYNNPMLAGIAQQQVDYTRNMLSNPIIAGNVGVADAALGQQADAKLVEASLAISQAGEILKRASADLASSVTRFQEVFGDVREADTKSSGGIVYASQGKLINFQPKGTDTVPAMLTPGEFVVNARSTAKNLPLLKAINNGASGYSNGGVVYLQNGGSVRSVQDNFRQLSFDDYNPLVVDGRVSLKNIPKNHPLFGLFRYIDQEMKIGNKDGILSGEELVNYNSALTKHFIEYLSANSRIKYEKIKDVNDQNLEWVMAYEAANAIRYDKRKVTRNTLEENYFGGDKNFPFTDLAYKLDDLDREAKYAKEKPDWEAFAYGLASKAIPGVLGAIGGGIGFFAGAATAPVTGPFGAIGGGLAGGMAGDMAGQAINSYLYSYIPEAIKKRIEEKINKSPNSYAEGQWTGFAAEIAGGAYVDDFISKGLNNIILKKANAARIRQELLKKGKPSLSGSEGLNFDFGSPGLRHPAIPSAGDIPGVKIDSVEDAVKITTDILSSTGDRAAANSRRVIASTTSAPAPKPRSSLRLSDVDEAVSAQKPRSKYGDEDIVNPRKAPASAKPSTSKPTTVTPNNGSLGARATSAAIAAGSAAVYANVATTAGTGGNTSTSNKPAPRVPNMNAAANMVTIPATSSTQANYTSRQYEAAPSDDSVPFGYQGIVINADEKLKTLMALKEKLVNYLNRSDADDIWSDKTLPSYIVGGLYTRYGRSVESELDYLIKHKIEDTKYGPNRYLDDDLFTDIWGSLNYRYAYPHKDFIDIEKIANTDDRDMVISFMKAYLDRINQTLADPQKALLTDATKAKSIDYMAKPEFDFAGAVAQRQAIEAKNFESSTKPSPRQPAAVAEYAPLSRAEYNRFISLSGLRSRNDVQNQNYNELRRRYRLYGKDFSIRQPKYASTGMLVPYEPKGTDTVPAMLTPGEFVVNRASTQKHLPLLKSINNSKGGQISYYATGGSVNSKSIDDRYQMSDVTVYNNLIKPVNSISNLQERQNSVLGETNRFSKDTNTRSKSLLTTNDFKAFDKKISQAAGLASGGLVYASKGQLINFSPKGTDTVPAMLTPGEFVVNRASTERHLPLLKAINSGAMSSGGIVYAQNGGKIKDIIRESEQRALASGMLIQAKDIDPRDEAESNKSVMSRYYDLAADPSEGQGLLAAPFYPRLQAAMDILGNIGEGRIAGKLGKSSMNLVPGGLKPGKKPIIGKAKPKPSINTYHGTGSEIIRVEPEKLSQGMLGEGFYVGLDANEAPMNFLRIRLDSWLSANKLKKGSVTAEQMTKFKGGIYPVKILGGIDDFLDADQILKDNPTALSKIESIYGSLKLRKVKLGPIEYGTDPTTGKPKVTRTELPLDLASSTAIEAYDNIQNQLAARYEEQLKGNTSIPDVRAESLDRSAKEMREIFVKYGIPGFTDLKNARSQGAMAAIFDLDRIRLGKAYIPDQIMKEIMEPVSRGTYKDIGNGLEILESTDKNNGGVVYASRGQRVPKRVPEIGPGQGFGGGVPLDEGLARKANFIDSMSAIEELNPFRPRIKSPTQRQFNFNDTEKLIDNIHEYIQRISGGNEEDKEFSNKRNLVLNRDTKGNITGKLQNFYDKYLNPSKDTTKGLWGYRSYNRQYQMHFQRGAPLPPKPAPSLDPLFKADGGRIYAQKGKRIDPASRIIDRDTQINNNNKQKLEAYLNLKRKQANIPRGSRIIGNQDQDLEDIVRFLMNNNPSELERAAKRYPEINNILNKIRNDKNMEERIGAPLPFFSGGLVYAEDGGLLPYLKYAEKIRNSESSNSSNITSNILPKKSVLENRILPGGSDLSDGMGAIEAISNVLGTGGAAVRALLSGKPVSDVLDFSGEGMRKRVSGRDLLRNYGMAGKNDSWLNFAGGMLTETLSEPSSIFGLAKMGIKSLGSARKNPKEFFELFHGGPEGLSGQIIRPGDKYQVGGSPGAYATLNEKTAKGYAVEGGSGASRYRVRFPGNPKDYVDLFTKIRDLPPQHIRALQQISKTTGVNINDKMKLTTFLDKAYQLLRQKRIEAVGQNGIDAGMLQKELFQAFIDNNIPGFRTNTENFTLLSPKKGSEFYDEKLLIPSNGRPRGQFKPPPPPPPPPLPKKIVNQSRGGIIYASEGQYVNFQPKGTDTVPAMLTPGEFVVNAKATAQHLPLLHAINGGSVDGMNKGGVVYLQQGGQVQNPLPDTDTPSITSDVTKNLYASRLKELINREASRGSWFAELDPEEFLRKGANPFAGVPSVMSSSDPTFLDLVNREEIAKVTGPINQAKNKALQDLKDLNFLPPNKTKETMTMKDMDQTFRLVPASLVLNKLLQDATKKKDAMGEFFQRRKENQALAAMDVGSFPSLFEFYNKEAFYDGQLDVNSYDDLTPNIKYKLFQAIRDRLNYDELIFRNVQSLYQRNDPRKIRDVFTNPDGSEAQDSNNNSLKDIFSDQARAAYDEMQAIKQFAEKTFKTDPFRRRWQDIANRFSGITFDPYSVPLSPFKLIELAIKQSDQEKANAAGLGGANPGAAGAQGAQGAAGLSRGGVIYAQTGKKISRNDRALKIIQNEPKALQSYLAYQGKNLGIYPEIGPVTDYLQRNNPKELERAARKYPDIQNYLDAKAQQSGQSNIAPFASGGIVYANNGALINAQQKGSDSVPAMLTPGEFVVNREAAQRHMPVLHAINQGYYSRGGIVQYLNNGGVVAPRYYADAGAVSPLQAQRSVGQYNGVNTTGSSVLEQSPKWLSELDEKINKVSSTLQDSLNGVFSNLNNMANQLNTVAQELPREMSITSNINKNVNVNGVSGEWSKYQGDILKMAGDQSAQQQQDDKIALSKWSEGTIPVVG